MDIVGEQGVTFASLLGMRVKAGVAVPQAGIWQALDVTSARSTVSAGESLPDLQSSYGTTIWQLVKA